MQSAVVSFYQDEERHWAARLECGHSQHVRHDPPWTIRPWVVTEEGRASRIGTLLECKLCDAEAEGRRLPLLGERARPRCRDTLQRMQ